MRSCRGFIKLALAPVILGLIMIGRYLNVATAVTGLFLKELRWTAGMVLLTARL